MSVLTFNSFCYHYGFYTQGLSIEEQSGGYIKLRNMVINKITPATEEETIEWENSKTEILKPVPDKYLSFLHPNLRPMIREKWDIIKDLGDKVEEFIIVK
jgi:hypothetical protein